MLKATLALSSLVTDDMRQADKGRRCVEEFALFVIGIQPVARLLL